LDKLRRWAGGHRRRLVQLYAALLYNAHLKGFAQGKIYTGAGKNLCVPGLNCYSCPGATAACPLGALQNAIAGAKVRAPFYILGTLMLFGLLLGRLVCGFLCPFGLVQELLFKLPTRKLQKSHLTRALSWLKYAILIVFAVLIPLAYALKDFPLPAFCKYICPAGTLEGALSLIAHPDNGGVRAMLGGLFSWKLAVMIAVLAACVFIFRAFCRFICPLGAIYSLFSKVALLGVRVDEDKCIGCGKCVRRCKMDVRRVGDHECIQCGACMAGCPTKAIGWKGPQMTKKRSRTAWTAAIALLLGILFFANIPGADAPQTGADPGMVCPPITVPTYSGGEFTLSEGTVTVINFWATWCGPCVEELPHFERLAESHPEIDVVAVHSELVTEDVPAWLAARDFSLTFALDETGEVLTSLGGGDMLPQTVVVNEEGIITYNAVGSVTYEELENMIRHAMG